MKELQLRYQKRTVAVIDIGTNSTKLLIASTTPTGLIRSHKFLRRTTRLGTGLSKNRKIARAGLDATVKTLLEFQRWIGRYKCDDTFTFSTYALRNADNADSVANHIQRKTGLAVRILSDREEARFAYLSARRTGDASKPHTLLVDVGGGSTEYVRAHRDRIVRVRSLPLGALHLTEKFLWMDPVTREAYAAMTDAITSAVDKAFASRASSLDPNAVDMVASGGSAFTVAKMLRASRLPLLHSNPPERIWIGDIERLLRECRGRSLAQRRRMPGLEADRADIIIAGLAVVQAFMRTARKRVIRVTTGGVREGALRHLIQHDYQW